jgi:hypothetical protein
VGIGDAPMVRDAILPVATISRGAPGQGDFADLWSRWLVQDMGAVFTVWGLRSYGSRAELYGCFYGF